MNDTESHTVPTLAPDWRVYDYTADLFDRGDDVILLDLGFSYVDSTMMRGEIGGVTWYVDLDAKRTPRWSYMVHGLHATPLHFGPMLYDDVANGLYEVSALVRSACLRRA